MTKLQIFFFLLGNLHIKGGFLLDETDKVAHLSSTLCGGEGGEGRGQGEGQEGGEEQ